jgi:molecular chaperone DnaJ
MRRDYYAVLGVTASASSVQIRRAYQRLARQYSPDVNLWERDARTLFGEIAEAYRVLSDPMARAVYDRRDAQAPSAAPSSGERPRAAGPRGDDLHVPIELAFAQAGTGLEADLSVERLSPCGACGATGAAPGVATVTCRYCAGLGTVWSGQQSLESEACPACDGTGVRVPEACHDCRGRGVRPARAQVHVVLSPGVDTGTQLRVPGEGHAGPFGGPRGDLIVAVRVHDDPVFVRKGDNLHREVSLGIVEAALGTRVTVEGIDGDVDLVVPPGTQPGHVFRVRGRGMPRLAGAGRGDLYVTARVEIPCGLDQHTQQLFRELGRILPPVRRDRRSRGA